MPTKCPKCSAQNLNTALTCAACSFPLSILSSPGYQLPPGTPLKHSKYIIEKTLGEGGFGITYKAVNDISAEVAIKELCPDKFLRQGFKIIWPSSVSPKAREEQIQKFQAEAESLQQCVHPNIVKVYDWFEENNTAYLVMEFVAGQSLAQILKTEKKLPENRITNYFLQLANALKIVHQNNFLHRDIKPDNIIINSEDKAILIDFGAAREFMAGITKKMTAMLTPGYAPLEQYAHFGKRHPSTDFYAFCASMYHGLTGVIPLASPARMTADTLAPPRQIVPSISRQIERVILTGMKLEPAERFQTADELINALKGELISSYLKRARELLKTNKIVEAVAAYEECLVREVDNGLAAVELAMLLMSVNQKQAAIAAYKAMEIQPDDGRIYGVLGLINCREANWEEALSLLQRAAFLAPDESWIQANFAWALAKLGYWEKAEKSCDRALELDGNSPFALGLKGWILVNRNRWVEAIRATRPAITKLKQFDNNYSWELQRWLYPCLTVAIDNALAGETAPDADRCIEEFIEQIEDSAFAWGYKGWKLATKGRWQEAIALLETATRQREVPEWAFVNLAVACERVGRSEVAIDIYRKKLNRTADDFCLYRLGSLLGERGEWWEARSHLEAAVKLNPNYAEAYHNLGWVLFHLIQGGEDSNFMEMRSAYIKAFELYEEQDKLDLATEIKRAFESIGVDLVGNRELGMGN
jgi:tetratricopeptide (TPR) repeat protein